MRVEFTLTPKLVSAGLFRFVSGVLRRRMVVVALCLLVFGVLAFSPRVRPLLKGAMIAMTAVSTLAFAGRYAAARRRSLSYLQKLGGEVKAVLSADAEGLRLENRLGVSNLPWALAGAIWVFDDVWLLFFGEADYMTVPSSAFAGSAGEFLKLAREKGKQIHLRGSLPDGKGG